MTRQAIFLSASVPNPLQQARYFLTADPIAIAAAISALVLVVIGRRLLVWGGHPSITPIIWTAAEDIGVEYGNWVRLYQSRLFADDFPAENALFDNVTYVDSVDNQVSPSLDKMRRKMLGDYDYSAGIFIGGMEGVEEEFALFKDMNPNAKVLPVASTGGAAKIIYEKYSGLPEVLASSLDYIGMMHRELLLLPTEKRRSDP